MKDNQQLNELIEKARINIMAAECTLWNFLGEQLDHDVNQRLGEDRLRFRVINALHDAERILRTISQCREDDKSLIEKKADAAMKIEDVLRFSDGQYKTKNDYYAEMFDDIAKIVHECPFDIPHANHP